MTYAVMYDEVTRHLHRNAARNDKRGYIPAVGLVLAIAVMKKV